MNAKLRNLILRYTIFGAVCMLLSVSLVGGCGTVGIEKPKYAVLEKEGPFELRRYEPQIVAETVVESDFSEAGNVAFDRLYGYISGQNRQAASIAMTAPVGQEPQSQKIAMTAPVGQERAGDQWVISFMMPSEYTMETLPQPLDPNVTLRQIPARRMAAVRYSGTWSQKRYTSHLSDLEGFIAERQWQVSGDPVFARYDPPFQLPFLRRNEILIPVN